MIKFNDIRPQWSAIKEFIHDDLLSLLQNSDYILGEEVSKFEIDFARWNGSQNAVGVSNGLDGLYIAAAVLDLRENVNVYVPENTFIATVLGIHRAIPHAKFITVPIKNDYLLDLEVLNSLMDDNSHSNASNIIIPVHLYGKAVDVLKIKEQISNIKSSYIIEDCSQAHGAFYPNTSIKVGNLGDINVFSLYPGKNLGGVGDGGIITCDNNDLVSKMRAIRNVGMYEKYKHDEYGGNYRLDSINALVLGCKLQFIDDWTNKRREIARRYQEEISNPLVRKPVIQNIDEHALHIYCLDVINRPMFSGHLESLNVENFIHYPIPWMKSRAVINLNVSTTISDLSYFNRIVSIPMHPFLTSKQVTRIIEAINTYHE